MADETPVISALHMDRSHPIGNSDDVFNRRALHTKIGNKTNEPVPVYISNEAALDPFFADAADQTDPGNDKTLISGSLAKITNFSRLNVSCRIESVVTFKVDGNYIASLRTSAAAPNASFLWEPKRTFPIGSSYEVIIKARPNSPISDCEASLMGNQTN